jgi:hypothetical protein
MQNTQPNLKIMTIGELTGALVRFQKTLTTPGVSGDVVFVESVKLFTEAIKEEIKSRSSGVKSHE